MAEEGLNQPPPLVDYNLFEADAPLSEALEREGAGWAHDWVSELGHLAGTEEAIAWGFQANENPPKLNLASGKLIFAWLGGGHNGGNLRFGPVGASVPLIFRPDIGVFREEETQRKCSAAANQK